MTKPLLQFFEYRHSGVLWVLFVNGNYYSWYSWDDLDPNSGYVMLSYKGVWTDPELQENWLMIMRHAQRRGWLDA